MRRTLATAVVLAGGAVAALAATPPDPQTQAVADGCGRNDQAAIANEAPEWAFVGDRDSPASGPPPPPQWLHGVVNGNGAGYMLSTHVSGGDIPTTHRAYDLNVDVLPDPAYAWLMGGDPATRTGNFYGDGGETARVHVELEETAIPRLMWPDPGDRVEILGDWVWDCGHWLPAGERTELHPFRALFVLRAPSSRSALGESEGDLFLTTDQTIAGKVATCAHRVKGDAAALKACVATEPDWQDVTGSYSFFVAAPPRPSADARLRWRVLDAGSTQTAPPLTVTPQPDGVVASFAVPPSLGPGLRRIVVARRVFVGWSPAPPRSRPEHLRVRFVRLLVRRAMDPACPVDRPSCPAAAESTHLGQQSALPGEWNVYWDVAGTWGMWSPPVLLVHRDGQVFAGRQTVDLYVARGKPWRLLVWTRECDWGQLGALAPCPQTQEIGVRAGDDVPGPALARFASPATSLGLHRVNSGFEESSCPRSNRLGCYQVTFRVSRVGR